jgi:carbamoyl-phosphate synthase small subunit
MSGRPGRIVLENGFNLTGSLFGAHPGSPVGAPAVASGETARLDKAALSSNLIPRVGEVVFNTAMTGYQEIITDPSYAGQVVMMTYPLIGNYGVNAEDSERERVHMRGLVVRERSRITSNFRSSGPLDEMLRRSGVPGIEGVDTRALTRILRDTGAMKGVIADAATPLDHIMAQIHAAPGLSDEDFVKQVTLAESREWTAGYSSKFADAEYLSARPAREFNCAAIDYGAKANIFRCLVQAGFRVRVYPCDVTADEIMAGKPDCVFLSNGPGDPARLDYAIATVKGLLARRMPIFGICLGHQILTWALGGSTYKLKFGHHGANHPVKDETTGKVEITSQNHGFATDPKTLPATLEVTHINLNDQVISGIRWKNGPAFSVQFHPEASPGPHDSLHLFARFHRMVSGLAPAAAA